jgi:Molybdopterin biosynthesis enzyme
MIIKPFINFLCTGKFILPKGNKIKTNFSMKKKNKRLEWLRVNINENKKEIIANKFKKQGSGMISSIAFADGILEIPENVKFIKKGDFYMYYSFKNLF